MSYHVDEWGEAQALEQCARHLLDMQPIHRRWWAATLFYSTYHAVRCSLFKEPLPVSQPASSVKASTFAEYISRRREATGIDESPHKTLKDLVRTNRRGIREAYLFMFGISMDCRYTCNYELTDDEATFVLKRHSEIMRFVRSELDGMEETNTSSSS